MYSSKKASGKERRITQARIRDLEYYLGDDWIDYGCIGADIVVAMYQQIATSAYQPKQCPSCKKYWHMQLVRQNYKKQTYLRNSIFGSIPCEKGTCQECISNSGKSISSTNKGA